MGSVGVSVDTSELDRIIAGLSVLDVGLDAAAKHVIKPETLDRYQGDAQQMVATAVYLAYSPSVYERTFELLSSVGAVEISNDPPTAGIVIDRTADNMAAGKPRDVAYARFFLPKEYGGAANSSNSFLNKHLVKHPDIAPERDFLALWMQIFGAMVPDELEVLIDAEILRL